MASPRVRIDYNKGRVTFTKSLIVKSVELLLQDTSYKTTLSKRQLIDWFNSHVHISLKGSFPNGSIFAIKTDTAQTVDVSYNRNVGFTSPTSSKEPISELELIYLFKQALTISTVVIVNQQKDEFDESK